MTNMQKILAQGFFYDRFNEKCHILHRTDEYIVYKYYSNKQWYFIAESMFEFEVHTQYKTLHTAERKEK